MVKKYKYSLLILSLLLAATMQVQAQQRDRLAELNVVCRNAIVTYTSVAPDGTLWMATMCGEIYRADDIHSPWKILKEGELLSDEEFENIAAFDRNTAVIVGNMWSYIRRTSTGGKLWNRVKYVSKRGHEWFHPIWRGQGGELWTGSQDGYLAFSTDRGRTFTVLRDTAFDRKMGIDDIYMLSSDSGWIAGHNYGLYSTSDNWRTYHYLPTPYGKSVSRVRPWKNHLIVTQSGKSYFTTVNGDGHWQPTPLTLSDFEVDNATGKLWAIDSKGEIILMEDLDKWKQMGVNALFIIGIHDGRLYCRVNEGVMRVGADGVVDHCPFLTAKRVLDAPGKTFTHGNLLWGFDEKSVYLHDAKGWYRVARPLDISGVTPDPDRNDRVIVLTYSGENFSIDTAGRIEPYTYTKPLADFVNPGLQSLEITTFSTLGYNVHKETIGFRRDGDLLIENARTTTEQSFDPHIKGGPKIKTSPVTVDNDSDKHQLSATSLERTLQTLGERYHYYPTPLDFGLNDTLLDLHEVYASGSIYSTNKCGYFITFVNRANDTLFVWGSTSAYVDLGGSTHYPWMLPMMVSWREAEFTTYQPCLWQTLREAMPDGMQNKKFLDNSTLIPRYRPCNGDQLFFKGQSSQMENAIRESTGSYTHVALMEVDSNGKMWVIEASPEKGVQRIKYTDWLHDNNGNCNNVYRLAEPFDTAAVIARAKSLIGKPYDNAFLPDNDAYYCSEFIQAVFDGIFESKPMNWRDADGNLPEYWEKHFKELGIPVPEGVPGTNPTDLSKSEKLKKVL